MRTNRNIPSPIPTNGNYASGLKPRAVWAPCTDLVGVLLLLLVQLPAAVQAEPAAPVIGTSPSITNSLAVINNDFVVAAGLPLVFNVGATDPVDNSLLQYQWTFGDGTTSAWSSASMVTHTYAAVSCGQYTASVMVSNAQFAISSNLTASVACQMTINPLQMTVNFAKMNADSASLTAQVALPGITNVIQLTGVIVAVDVGGAQVAFTLDTTGHGVNANGTCGLLYTKIKTVQTYWTVTINLSNGSWRNQWAAFGLINTTIKSPGVAVTIPVTLMIGNTAFAAEAHLPYIAVMGKAGKAGTSGGGGGTGSVGGTPGGGGVPMALTLTATATLQGPATDNGTINKAITSTIKISTQYLISQIYAATGAGTPPSGAKLMLNPDGSVNVTDSKGNVLQDASGAIQVSFDPNGAGVWAGQSNDNTGQTSYTGNYISTITFQTDPNGDTATMSGLTKETYSLSAPNATTGSQAAADTISVTGAGEGSYQDSQENSWNLIVAGTVSASGKGTTGQ